MLFTGDSRSDRQIVRAKRADIYVKVRQQRFVFATIDQFRQTVEPRFCDHRLGDIEFVENPGQRVPVDRHGAGDEKQAFGVIKLKPLHLRLAINRPLDVGDADAQAIVRFLRLDLINDIAMTGIAIQPQGSPDQTKDDQHKDSQQAARDQPEA